MKKPAKLADTLTRKQKHFADRLLANPKGSATEAAQNTYEVKNRNVARSIATENLSKPAVMAYLNNHATKAEMTLINALDASKSVYKFNPETKENELLATEDDHSTRIKAADSILDRVHGKAAQRVEHVGVVAHVMMDLSGGKAGQPPQEVIDQLED